MEKKEEQKFDEINDFTKYFAKMPFDNSNTSLTQQKSLFDENSGLWVFLLIILFSNNRFYTDKDISDIEKRLSKVEGQIDILKERK